ncbi:MAG TPA: precorrin-3B C(17)-methyltransferase [Stellaceae bacterium]|jgi:cobalt-precorrin 5A hydrolase/precorrin-3B C17-methyltransferase|nr:precorrin-3B C(17)-methyltransferase [Stellaceae bacterium]
MTSGLPHDAAVVVLGPGGAALGRRACAVLPGARLYGPRAHIGDWDETYDRLMPLLAELFAAGRPIVGVCASGILIRALAPLIDDKRLEPPVVALAEDGSVAVPLLGGHHGANALARALAEMSGGIAAITTAGDLRLGIALDETPPGWRIGNPERIKPVASALLASEPVALIEEAAPADWLRAGSVHWAEAATKKVIVTDRAVPPNDGALVFHPPVLALGIGCERGCPAAEIAELVRDCLKEAGLAAGAVAAIVSVELKAGEPGIHALAGSLGVPARFFPASRLLAETSRLTRRSAAAFRATGCWGVAEGAALAAVGPEGKLVVTRRQSRHATCAVARAAVPLDATALGRARGRLAIVGIGPGDPAWRTPEASDLIAAADDIIGYRLYLDLLGRLIAGKRRHDSDIGAEAERVRLALDLAAAGGAVALVSSGDPGIYGLAALVFELIDRESRRDWSAIEIAVAPGISAMQAAAARVGAPLGHDFCAISLSDLLTPWEVIRARIEAVAGADLVIALYNPRSARRPSQLAEAARILLAHRPPETPCVIARNLGRTGESHRILRLDELGAAAADMLSLVLVGSTRTRIVAGETPLLYTPRGYFDDGKR